MTWPRCQETEDNSVEWRLRYGPNPPNREDVLYAASVMHAYQNLIAASDKTRREVVKTLRAAEKTPAGHAKGE